MNTCDSDNLFLQIKRFRDAIISACSSGAFSCRDRMSRFPRGCCDDASDLLAYYLYSVYSIQTIQFNGVYFDEKEPENTTNHSWLMYEEYIIDITYSQFAFVTHSKEDIYFGKENEFFQSLERIHKVNNYNIMESDRLKNDYRSIMNHLKNE